MNRATVKAAAGAVDRVSPRHDGVVVLIYHRVGAGSGGEVDLAVDEFEAQAEWLAATGRVVSLDEAVERLVAGAPGGGPARPIVLTFDDGTTDFCEHAVPVLARHGLPATLYLTTEPVVEGATWPDGCPAPSWAALAEALASGVVSIGSHTHRHRLLDRLPAHELDDELDRSTELIGEHLGVEARHFAYPKALAPSPAAHDAVRRRFRSAALAGTRVNRWGRTDVHRLARSPVQVSDGERWFRAKADGGMWFEDALRRAANTVRYRGRTT